MILQKGTFSDSFRSTAKERFELLDGDTTTMSELETIELSCESESNILSGIIAMDAIPNNKYVNNMLGLEGRASEIARGLYYKVKQRGKQLYNFLFGSIIKFFKGSTDVKVIIKKHYSKIKDYEKAMSDRRVGDNADKELTLRNTKDNLLRDLAVMSIVIKLFNDAINAMDELEAKDGDDASIKYMVCVHILIGNIVKGFKLVSSKGKWEAKYAGINASDLVNQLMSELKMDSIKSKFENVQKYILEDSTSNSAKTDGADDYLKLSFDTEQLKSYQESLKDKDDSTTEYTLSTAREECLNDMRLFLKLLDPANGVDWDFSKATKKLEKLRKKIDKMFDEGYKEVGKNMDSDIFGKSHDDIHGKKDGSESPLRFSDLYDLITNKTEYGLEAKRSRDNRQAQNTPNPSANNSSPNPTGSQPGNNPSNNTNEPDSKSEDKKNKILKKTLILGSQTSNVITAVGSTLSSFKTDMDIFQTEIIKVGSMLFKK